MPRPAMPIEQRLDGLIYKTDTCWLWVGHINKRGYAYIQVKGVSHKAHRFVYEHYVGPIPDGMTLDHTCRVKHCVNPAHMEVVTAKENYYRWFATVTTCPSGHPYDEANTYITPGGSRQCRTCNRERQKALRSRGSREVVKSKEGRRKPRS